jgi:GNAT superfamily N-acetyltransferase
MVKPTIPGTTLRTGLLRDGTTAFVVVATRNDLVMIQAWYGDMKRMEDLAKYQAAEDNFQVPDSGSGNLLICKRGKSIIGRGLVDVHTRPPRGIIQDLFVLNAEREKGVARMLIEGGEEYIRRRGLTEAEIGTDQQVTLERYLSYGYTILYDSMWEAQGESVPNGNNIVRYNNAHVLCKAL